MCRCILARNAFTAKEAISNKSLRLEKLTR